MPSLFVLASCSFSWSLAGPCLRQVGRFMASLAIPMALGTFWPHPSLSLSLSPRTLARPFWHFMAVARTGNIHQSQHCQPTTTEIQYFINYFLIKYNAKVADKKLIIILTIDFPLQTAIFTITMDTIRSVLELD